MNRTGTNLEQELTTIARLERKRTRLGGDAVCAVCGESDPRCLHLVPQGRQDDTAEPVVLCANCHCRQQGQSVIEQHHPAGRANNPATVRIAANEHALLSDAQHDWPRDTLRNPTGSPLLAASASVRGMSDVLRVLLERVLVWLPAFLEWLDGRLRDLHGDRWWDTLGWQGRGS